MSKTAKILFAFCMGQIVQIAMNILAHAWYMNRPVLFCAGAGFLVTMAVVAGITLAGADKPKRGKTYSEWAEPGVDLHE